jgi:nitrite reductase/ring-hydroxylating ferredoxin subunit
VKATLFPSDDLPPGSIRDARLGPIPVVVVRTTSGALYVLTGRCLHQGGPLSRGGLGWASESSEIVGQYQMEEEQQILRCPWHGYEYDVTSGCTLVGPKRALQTFKAWDQDGQVVAEY